MNEPLVYECDQAEFMERAKRSHALHDQLREGKVDDAQAWADAMKSLLSEVTLPPLVIGVRYRVRILKGDFEFRHAHGTTADGREIGLDIPMVTETSMAELEGRYGGRAPKGGPYGGLHLFDIGDQRASWAAIADTDVLRLEEVRGGSNG